MRVELSATALAELDALIRVLSLPSDTRARVVASLRPLERLPELGVELGGRWAGLRAVLGPWRWLIIVYVVLDDRVVVVTCQDARTSVRAEAR